MLSPAPTSILFVADAPLLRQDSKHSKQTSRLLFLLLIVMVGCLPGSVQAETLPIKTYTIADGLARDSVTCILQDSHGFMWFCTAGGLSRFDGYTFTNYDKRHGLPSDYVSSLLETRNGVYWGATSGGLALFDPARNPGNDKEHRFLNFSLAQKS